MSNQIITPFSQLNPLWRWNFLGTSKTTIGGYGCTISCLDMASNKNPGEVNKALQGVYKGFVNENGGTSSANLVNWTKIETALKNLRFIYRYKTYDNAVAKDAIKKYGFVLAEVDWDGNPKTPKDSHWIILVGNQQMYDPMTFPCRIEKTGKYKIYKGLAVLQQI